MTSGAERGRDVVVVGAGIAGAACAHRCARAGLRVLVLDRGRRAGGRLAVRTLRDVPAVGRTHPVDLGAAGFSAADPAFARVVDDWRARGLVRDWTDRLGTATPDGLGPGRPDRLQLAAPAGLRSLVEDLLDLPGVETLQDTVVEAVGPALEVQVADGTVATGRAVVLAMPGPQAGRLLAAHPAVRDRAEQDYEPGLALLARWPAADWPQIDRVEVAGLPPVRLIVDDGRRRGDAAPVLVAHASPEFAAEHLADPAAAAGAMVAGIRRVLDIRDPPLATRVQRWTFSRALARSARTFDLADGIGLCGDGWSASGDVEGAWRSGDDLGAALVGALAR